MPVHHDKSVYGKLAPTQELFSEEQLIAMAQALQEDEKGQNTLVSTPKTQKNSRNKAHKTTKSKRA